MSKLSVILVSVFILALGAGVMADKLVSRVPRVQSPSTPADGAIDRSLLTEQLQLTPAQREQMRLIWEAMRETSRTSVDDAQILQKEREDAVVKLLTKEQKGQYEKIGQDYEAKFQKLSAQRDAAFADAVDKTRKILTEPQRQKYEEILKERIGRVPGLNSAHGGPAFLEQPGTREQP